MTSHSLFRQEEPVIAVGLLDRCASVRIGLQVPYMDSAGVVVPAGELHVESRDGELSCGGVWKGEARELTFTPVDSDGGEFSLDVTIGIDFHWQQQERQTFRGALQLLSQPDNRLAVVNRIPLEAYLTSAVCSEMKASAPAEFIKAHAIISRSWLLAQLVARGEPVNDGGQVKADRAEERVRWTDREAHADFDVCADDHCQRYQGTARIDAPGVVAAIGATRGEVLTYDELPCDARFSKSCGGVSEVFQTAWGEADVPYLVALRDAPGPNRKPPPLFDDPSMREFLLSPPTSYCDCRDASLLQSVLNDYDLATEGFFRWRVRLPAEEAGRLVERKLGIDLGRLLNLEPVERGPSGRLKRLRLVGERSSLVIGKELEIRRALSETHLYSSAFVVDAEGLPQRPEAFLLTGAGWGHGVGLCQIGAAVMAEQGADYRQMLEHYYPGTQVEHFYR